MTILAILLAAAAETAAPGSASAQALDLKDGMSLIDGSMITAIFTGMAAVIGAIGGIFWKNRRDAKAARPVDTDDRYVTMGECKQHRCALEKEIAAVGPALNRVFNKLTDLDRKSEERAVKLHERVGPIAEKVAADNAKIDTIGKVVEAALAKSTVGGAK